MKPFPCTSCGACCNNIDSLKETTKELVEEFPEMEFPYGHKDGVCEKLIDNQCSVYEQRPLICNMEKLSELTGLPREDFFDLNIKACNQLMNEQGIAEEFRIVVR